MTLLSWHPTPISVGYRRGRECQKTMSATMKCDKCGEEPKLETEGQYDLLHVSCACKGRYVNVKEVLPERWSQ